MYIFSKLFITIHSCTYRQNIAQHLYHSFIPQRQYECSSRRQNVHFQSYTHVFAIIVTINLNIFLKINIHVQCVCIYMKQKIVLN